MRQNPWDKIYKQCNVGTNQEKLDKLPVFPLYIDLELSNLCNFRCVMCPTGRGVSIRKQGLLSTELFQKILHECRLYNCHIRFVRWGEPLIHPRCMKFAQAVKNAGLLCHINTNGSFFDFELITDILQSKLDSIKFSFQGVSKQEYESVRKGGSYDELIEWIRQLYSHRRTRSAPYIIIGTTTSRNADRDISFWKQYVQRMADKVTVGRTKNIIAPTDKTNLPSCPEVFTKLSINHNGDVTACCADWNNQMILGNVKNQSLREIWTGKAISHYRDMLVNNRHQELELCRHCVL